MPHSAASEIKKEREKKAAEVIDILKKTYPDASIALSYANPWQLLVAVVLSAQTTDEQVNKVTAELFPKYRQARIKKQESGIKDNELKELANREKTEQIQEITNYASVKLEDLQEDISSVGFYKNKAKYIQKAARMILEEYEGNIPDTIEKITKLPGVARKTGHIVIGNAYGADRVEGIAVDTHVARLSQRLRLVDINRISGKSPKKFTKNGKEILDYYKSVNTDKIERQLMEVVPRKDWFRVTYWLIEHGRQICSARSPKCSSCPVSGLCPVSRI